MSVQQRSRPPIPRLSGLTRSRRRSSLPAGADLPTTASSSGHGRAQPSSPEVISSLIDSLSAISFPAQNHFERLPVINGVSVSSPASPAIVGDNAMQDSVSDYIAYRQSLRDNDLLYPDDAAEPPVIKTSKPPSGLSPLTAPRKKDREHSLKNYIRGAGGSSSSLHSSRSLRSVSSIGNISIEAPRRASNISPTRTSSESKRSAKHRSLMYMSSRERLRAKEAERKRATVSGSETTVKPPQLFISQDTIREEPAVAESSRASHPATGVESPLRSARGSLSSEVEGAGPGLIPDRGSSLRHAASPSRVRRKGHSRRSSRHDASRTKPVPEEDEAEHQRQVTRERILKELEEEEHDVARRIRELKKAKALRDKLAGKLPAGFDAGARRPPSPVSVADGDHQPGSGASGASSVSSLSDQRKRDASKAHKVLGIAMAPPPERSASYDHSAAQRTKHLRSRSLTVNDGDGVAPQTLDRTADRPSPSPPPPAGSRGSSKGPTGTPARSKSAAVALGRAGSGRRAASMASSSTTHKHSTSATSAATTEPSHRSASEEITRNLSLNAASSPGDAQRARLKKNRWSHPDLPAKVEQRRNDMSAAVQKPAQPVIEERPSSLDSIDRDVHAYLDEPRLSQRIRHPQTGRVVAFSEFGAPDGFAVFCCVGMGLTRYVMAFYDQLAATLRLRLITPDRPGVGGSPLDPNGTPLSWPDDVLVICQSLRITKFSLLAHSAGAVYALATALRMPQHIRGRVHLLAPWIPPSQMAPVGVHQEGPPGGYLPRSQRILRALPPSLLKVANSTLLSATSASMSRNTPKSSPKSKRKSVAVAPPQSQRPPIRETRRESIMLMDQVLPNKSTLSLAAANPSHPAHEEAKSMKAALSQVQRERQHEFDARLTFAIWDRATLNANPATDLIVCLETRQSIGFRYEDITRGVVIHHGSKDSRVPVENVRWLGRMMRRCEVRIIDGEAHGLMASALVMGNVLTEMAREWEDWTAVVQGKSAVTESPTKSP